MRAWVDILGKRFTVRARKMDDKHGELDGEKCRIDINPKANVEEQRDVLLHESIHALDALLRTKLRERQVAELASGLMHWLRANREIVLWILDTPEPRLPKGKQWRPPS